MKTLSHDEILRLKIRANAHVIANEEEIRMSAVGLLALCEEIMGLREQNKNLADLIMKMPQPVWAFPAAEEDED